MLFYPNISEEGYKNTYRDAYNSFFNDLSYEEKKKELNNKMDETLDSLTDANVGDLKDIDSSTMPDGQRTYELYPLFERTDMKRLSHRISKLTNKGKREFKNFLHGHYKLWCQVDGVREYANDKDKLTELLSLLQVESVKAIKVDKYAYDHLIECVENCVKRAEGERSVLM